MDMQINTTGIIIVVKGSCFEELNWYIPMLENYEQTTMDKFIRKLKL